MPAGVSWSRYLFFVGSAIASMLAGGATVRWILKPDLVSLSLSVICIINRYNYVNTLQTIPELSPPEHQSELYSKSKDK